MTSPYKDLVIVGIGASAGGLEALETMFDEMPVDRGMAFVIVQHLSPDFKSLMVELLERHTKMAVHRVTDNMPVERDSLYLIPPRQDMIIKDGKLLLTERKKSKELSLPIDLFFNSLATEKGAKSVGIILSGTGSDGSRGVKKIHDAGGVVIVQKPESARFDGMPRSAIDSGHSDVLADPEEMPALLEEYVVHQDRATLCKQNIPNNESALEKIFRAIQARHRIEFSSYRPSTIGRRIERRIDMDSSVNSLLEYADLVTNDVIELDLLYKDLLINVTEFFRDTEPFESLERNALEKLLLQHPLEEEFRVWVAACATGEEAYSVAILIDECCKRLDRQISVKVFATDISRASIAKATAGTYPEDLLKGVSKERLARYFVRTDAGYQIVSDIRRTVVFAPHNLLGDPPFTRLSLVTCRNFLIYLLPKSQNKVLSHFHFGLKKGGYLLLGSSESPGELSNEFQPVDPRNRLFLKHSDARLKNPMFSSVLPQAALPMSRYFQTGGDNGAAIKDPHSLKVEEVLGNLMPPGIVIDTSNRVTQVFRNAGKYLKMRDGILSSNLLDLVDKDLKVAIGGAIQRCGRSGEPVCYERLQVRAANNEVEQVKLTVTPLPAGDTPSKFVITLEELSESGSELLAHQTERIDLDEVSREQLVNLELELKHSREILQATNEEMETSNEELQATNEELIASNEELQSANEELHSVNEELLTVNGEYQRKINELTVMTHDFDNLLESTDVHTLFLDKDQCIRKFTPRMADVLHLVSHDIGRNIEAFLHNMKCDGLGEKIERVLESGTLWEEQIKSGNNTDYLMRILPYRAGTLTSGVVLTLVDISKLAAAQASITLERERFERAIKANRDGTWDWADLGSDEMWWSAGCYQLLGYEPDAFPALHSAWLKLIHPDDREKIQQTSIPDADKCFVEVHRVFEYRMLHSSGKYRWYCHRAIVDFDSNGDAIRMTGSIADIHDRKFSETMDREGIRLRDNFLSMLSHELRNPIGAVVNAMQNIEGRESDFENNKEMAVIQRQSRQMTRLLDDLLDVARFGRDRIEFRKEIVDLCSLAASAIESVDFQLENRQQVLRTSVCEGPLNVIGDPARLSQAQTNLIINASKFSQPGQEITYTIERIGEAAVITVVDEGIGIEPDMLEQVFEMFVQSFKTLDHSAGGMGVGLSLSRKIIDAHNGTITADSEGHGKGSTFQIRLPLTTLKHEQRNVVRPNFLDRSLVCKIMLVEDNSDAREMLAKTFHRRGFDVLEAPDGETALELLEDFEPRVAVIDIGLPGMSGEELAEKIRKDQRWDDVMLIALTGFGQSDEKLASLQAGFDHHFTKPLQFSELHDLILTQLSSESAGVPQ